MKNGPKDTDESTDTYDTIDWLVKHVPGNNGKVGIWGISQPGFYATAGMIDAHPALVAVAPQAPVTDYYMGDDVYHNGAFMLAHRFSFYMGFRNREGDPAPPRARWLSTLAPPTATTSICGWARWPCDEKYFKHQQPMWNMNIDHTSYDENWQSRAIWKYLKAVKPAVMLVGGWYNLFAQQGSGVVLQRTGSLFVGRLAPLRIESSSVFNQRRASSGSASSGRFRTTCRIAPVLGSMACPRTRNPPSFRR